MAYQALYRRFRPNTFDAVVGQEHITTTLKNQIISNNIAHAYLFSGTRGTGKTSTAKIFARAVNCLDNKDGNPCNECEVCKGILDDTIMDVVEMDAASNNSVDDIRELREKVKYLPSKGKYKVYIIDEVHMLSKGAFNALLKTLEEPPKHLLFILATTEPQRIPATILSRCQRFDFKRITTEDIVKNMRKICNDIGVEIDERSLYLIARNSDGAMRDALSILDQCVSFNDGEITYEYVLSILGTVNNDFLFEVCESIISKDLDKSLELVDNIVRMGKDINQFIKDLILHFRNLMLAKTATNLESIIDGSDEYINQLLEQSRKLELDDIISYLNILSEAEVQSKWSSQPRVILEVSIIKIIDSTLDQSVEGLVRRIKQLENMIERGTFSAATIKTEKKMEGLEVKPTEKEILSDATLKEGKKVKISEEEKDLSSQQKEKQRPIKDIDLNKLLKAWPDILKKIKGEKITIHAFLMEGKLIKLKDGILTISFDDGFGFHKEAVEKKENKEYIENTINDYLETDIKIKCVMSSEIDNSKTEETEDEDVIKKIVDVFGDDIVEIQ